MSRELESEPRMWRHPKALAATMVVLAVIEIGLAGLIFWSLQ